MTAKKLLDRLGLVLYISFIVCIIAGVGSGLGYWVYTWTPLHSNHEFKTLIGIPRPGTPVEVSVTYDFVMGKITEYADKAIYSNSLTILDAERDEAEKRLAKAREFGNISAQGYERLRREFAVAESNWKKAHAAYDKAQDLLWYVCRAAYDAEYFRFNTQPKSCPNIQRWDESGGDFL